MTDASARYGLSARKRARLSRERSDLRSARFVPFPRGKQTVAARAAGEGPRAAGIDGECESTPRGDARTLRVNATEYVGEARSFPR